MTTKWFPSVAVTLGLIMFIAIADLYGPPYSDPLGPQLEKNWTTNSPSPGTNWIDPLKATNLFVWEEPQPSKVTIWFRYYCDARPDAFGIITTNVWPVTLSNATQMVLSHLKTRPGNWTFITITGIWRDE